MGILGNDLNVIKKLKAVFLISIILGVASSVLDNFVKVPEWIYYVFLFWFFSSSTAIGVIRVYAAYKLHRLGIKIQFKFKRNECNAEKFIKAVEEGNADVVRWILLAGIDPNVKSNRGKTILEISVQKGDYRTADLLKEAGAKE